MLSVRLRWGSQASQTSSGLARRDSVAAQPLHRRSRSGDHGAGHPLGRRASVGSRGHSAAFGRHARQSGLLTQLRAYNDPVAVVCAARGDAVLVVSRKHFGVLRLNWCAAPTVPLFPPAVPHWPYLYPRPLNPPRCACRLQRSSGGAATAASDPRSGVRVMARTGVPAGRDRDDRGDGDGGSSSLTWAGGEFLGDRHVLAWCDHAGLFVFALPELPDAPPADAAEAAAYVAEPVAQLVGPGPAVPGGGAAPASAAHYDRAQCHVCVQAAGGGASADRFTVLRCQGEELCAWEVNLGALEGGEPSSPATTVPAARRVASAPSSRGSSPTPDQWGGGESRVLGRAVSSPSRSAGPAVVAPCTCTSLAAAWQRLHGGPSRGAHYGAGPRETVTASALLEPPAVACNVDDSVVRAISLLRTGKGYAQSAGKKQQQEDQSAGAAAAASEGDASSTPPSESPRGSEAPIRAPASVVNAVLDAIPASAMPSVRLEGRADGSLVASLVLPRPATPGSGDRTATTRFGVLHEADLRCLDAAGLVPSMGGMGEGATRLAAHGSGLRRAMARRRAGVAASPPQEPDAASVCGAITCIAPLAWATNAVDVIGEVPCTDGKHARGRRLCRVVLCGTSKGYLLVWQLWLLVTNILRGSGPCFAPRLVLCVRAHRGPVRRLVTCDDVPCFGEPDYVSLVRPGQAATASTTSSAATPGRGGAEAAPHTALRVRAAWVASVGDTDDALCVSRVRATATALDASRPAMQLLGAVRRGVAPEAAAAKADSVSAARGAFQPLHRLASHSARILRVHWRMRTGHVLAECANGCVHCWRLAGGTLERTLPAHALASRAIRTEDVMACAPALATAPEGLGGGTLGLGRALADAALDAASRAEVAPPLGATGASAARGADGSAQLAGGAVLDVTLSRGEGVTARLEVPGSVAAAASVSGVLGAAGRLFQQGPPPTTSSGPTPSASTPMDDASPAAGAGGWGATTTPGPRSQLAAVRFADEAHLAWAPTALAAAGAAAAAAPPLVRALARDEAAARRAHATRAASWAAQARSWAAARAAVVAESALDLSTERAAHETAQVQAAAVTPADAAGRASPLAPSGAAGRVEVVAPAVEGGGSPPPDTASDPGLARGGGTPQPRLAGTARSSPQPMLASSPRLARAATDDHGPRFGLLRPGGAVDVLRRPILARGISAGPGAARAAANAAAARARRHLNGEGQVRARTPAAAVPPPATPRTTHPGSAGTGPAGLASGRAALAFTAWSLLGLDALACAPRSLPALGEGDKGPEGRDPWARAAQVSAAGVDGTPCPPSPAAASARSESIATPLQQAGPAWGGGEAQELGGDEEEGPMPLRLPRPVRYRLALYAHAMQRLVAPGREEGEESGKKERESSESGGASPAPAAAAIGAAPLAFPAAATSEAPAASSAPSRWAPLAWRDLAWVRSREDFPPMHRLGLGRVPLRGAALAHAWLSAAAYDLQQQQRRVATAQAGAVLAGRPLRIHSESGSTPADVAEEEGDIRRGASSDLASAAAFREAVQSRAVEEHANSLGVLAFDTTECALRATPAAVPSVQVAWGQGWHRPSRAGSGSGAPHSGGVATEAPASASPAATVQLCRVADVARALVSLLRRRIMATERGRQDGACVDTALDVEALSPSVQMLSALLPWGVNAEEDHGFTSVLGARRPQATAVGFALPGAAGALTLLLPHACQGEARWSHSARLTALHSLSLVALCMTLMEGVKAGQGYFSRLITSLGVLLPTTLRPVFKEPSLALLAQYGLDAAWDDASVAARLLLQGCVERLPPHVRISSAGEWAARLLRADTGGADPAGGGRDLAGATGGGGAAEEEGEDPSSQLPSARAVQGRDQMVLVLSVLAVSRPGDISPTTARHIARHLLRFVALALVGGDEADACATAEIAATGDASSSSSSSSSAAAAAAGRASGAAARSGRRASSAGLAPGGDGTSRALEAATRHEESLVAVPSLLAHALKAVGGMSAGGETHVPHAATLLLPVGGQPTYPLPVATAAMRAGVPVGDAGTGLHLGNAAARLWTRVEAAAGKAHQLSALRFPSLALDAVFAAAARDRGIAESTLSRDAACQRALRAGSATRVPLSGAGAVGVAAASVVVHGGDGAAIAMHAASPAPRSSAGAGAVDGAAAASERAAKASGGAVTLPAGGGDAGTRLPLPLLSSSALGSAAAAAAAELGMASTALLLQCTPSGRIVQATRWGVDGAVGTPFADDAVRASPSPRAAAASSAGRRLSSAGAAGGAGTPAPSRSPSTLRFSQLGAGLAEGGSKLTTASGAVVGAVASALRGQLLNLGASVSLAESRACATNALLQLTPVLNEGGGAGGGGGRSRAGSQANSSPFGLPDSTSSSSGSGDRGGDSKARGGASAMTPGGATALLLGTSPSAYGLLARAALGAELLAKGFTLWRPSLADLPSLIRRLLRLVTAAGRGAQGFGVSSGKVTAAAQLALVEVGVNDPQVFVRCVGAEAVRSNASSHYRKTAVLALVALVRKHPSAIVMHVAAATEAIIRTLDPSDPYIRKVRPQPHPSTAPPR